MPWIFNTPSRSRLKENCCPRKIVASSLIDGEIASVKPSLKPHGIKKEGKECQRNRQPKSNDSS
jgi:hypothetical protein